MSSKSVSIWLRYSNTKLNILTVTLRRKICSKAIQFLKLCFTLPQPEHIYTSKDLLGGSKIWARLPGGLIESAVSCSLWMMDSAVSLLLQSLAPRCAWLEEFSFFFEDLDEIKAKYKFVFSLFIRGPDELDFYPWKSRDQCCGAGPFLTGSGSEYFFSPAPAPAPAPAPIKD